MESTKYCPQCRDVKPLDQFSLDRSRRDGTRFRCKSCDIKAHNLKKYGSEERPRDLLPAEHKRCSRCHEVKPFTAFHASHRRPDSCVSRCKACIKQMRVEKLAGRDGPALIVAQKPCIQCGEDKPIEDYHRSIDASDGHYAQCKACNALKARATAERRRSERKPANIAEKTCTRCSKTRPIAWFGKNVTIRDGRSSYCRPCIREMNGPAYAAAKARRSKIDSERLLRRIHERRLWLARYKADRGCCQCRESDPRCLDFDHIDPATKRENVSALANRGVAWEFIFEELERVVVRCANCHRKRHGAEYVWYHEWLADPSGPDAPDGSIVA